MQNLNNRRSVHFCWLFDFGWLDELLCVISGGLACELRTRRRLRKHLFQLLNGSFDFFDQAFAFRLIAQSPLDDFPRRRPLLAHTRLPLESVCQGLKRDRTVIRHGRIVVRLRPLLRFLKARVDRPEQVFDMADCVLGHASRVGLEPGYVPPP